jgi:hypothetical protein
MSKERLSKLQKWILVKALERDLPRIEIYQGFYDLHKMWDREGQSGCQDAYETEKERDRAKSAYPVVTSSLHRLTEKGLIEPWTSSLFTSGWAIKDPIHLTDAGREKALKLKSIMDHNELKDNKLKVT